MIERFQCSVCGEVIERQEPLKRDEITPPPVCCGIASRYIAKTANEFLAHHGVLRCLGCDNNVVPFLYGGVGRCPECGGTSFDRITQVVPVVLVGTAYKAFERRGGLHG